MTLRSPRLAGPLLLVGLLGLVLTVGLELAGSRPAAASEHPPLDWDSLSMIPERGWGVSGQTPQDTQTETLDVLVWDMVQSGDYMFVGGAFLEVQESKRATPTSQPYLAAFEVSTGEWVDTFRPSFDRAIYALDVLPNGSVLVGGEFETVNGVTRRGLVAIDEVTGAIDPSFDGAVDRPWSSRRATVRDIEVEPDGAIHVAGNFSHLDGPGGSRTQVSKAGRFADATGTIDANWKPIVSGGAVWGLDTDPTRGEVALSGFFTSVNGEPSTGHFHVVDDTTGATMAGKIELPRNYPWSQPEMFDVVYGDDLVFVIGEQHIVQVIDADDHQMLGFHKTGSPTDGFGWTGGFAGGAYQAGDRIGDVIIAGCHCTHADDNHFESFSGRFTTRHNVMAYDATTGHHIEAFDADVDSPRDGHWAAASDTTGCLWIGGDYHVGGDENDSARWLGGFARLCSPNPPIVVTDPGPQTTDLGDPVSLQIQASGGRDASYQYSATGLPAGLAIEAETGLITGTADRLETTTVVVTVEAAAGAGQPGTASFDWEVAGDPGAVLLPAGSSWRYEDGGADLGTAWRRPDFDDGAWATGDAEFGFGDDDETTPWTSGNVTYYARTEFQFSGPEPAALQLDLVADDGAVVYLNGTEILRDNLPDGAITASTTAQSWRGGDDERFQTHLASAVPLVEGRNVLAVEVHNVWSQNNDLSFDLRLTPSEQGGGPALPIELVAAGSDWANTDSTDGEPADWKQGLQGVEVGAAELGFGDGDETTTLTPGADAYYFTRTFELDDPQQVTQLTLGLAADDGAVVYLNGSEVHRFNMPDGVVTPQTRPITWVAGADEAFKTTVLSPDALVPGTNTIAVEVHNLWPGNADLTFDLYLTN